MEQSEQSFSEKKKVLLVEDDPLLIDIYTTKFQEAGYAVQVVDHGEKALEAAGKDRPDIILLDIVLPHMDGWDILRALKASEQLRDTPVVVLSNLGQKEEIEKGLKLGAAKYLLKAHYTPSEVVQELASFL